MHAIGNALLKAGVGCVVNQTAKAVLESPGKNRNDFRQLNASIDSFKRGITDVKSQLDGIARKDLLASISFFNEGFVYLCQVFNEASSVTGMNARLPTMAEASTPGSQTSSAAWLEAISLIKALILDLNDSAIRMLSDAKERFKDARRKATKAFCNEALSTSERIFAMRCRVAATLLEKVDNPVGALIACKLCLEELNSMPAVKENFGGKRSDTGNPLVKEVCDVNSVICDITQQFGHGVGELLNWPCVTVRNGAKIDPLHNAGTRHCCLTWSFGQEGEEEHQLKFAWGITSNTRGDFIVADSVDRNVKVFNGSGRFLYSLYPFAEDLQSKDDYEVWNVASDGNDDLYVLTLRRNDFPMANLSEVRVFNKDGHPKHKFALRDGFRGSSIAVDDNNRVFVTGGAFSGCHNDVIEVYNNGGVFMHSFGNEHLKNAQDVTIANTDRLVVLNGEKGPLVLLFSNEGQLLKKFAVQGSTADDSGVAVTFHKASKTVLVASLQSETGIEVSMYSENGQFVRRIQFKTKGCRFITGITTTAKGRIAVPSQNVVFFG